MSKKKSEQLGMNFSTAQHQLRKNVMFALMIRCGLNNCHQCGKKIETPKDLSIEHKIPWLDSENPKDLFWDLNNLAFSHLTCNVRAADHSRNHLKKHGVKRWRAGCRCRVCLDAKNEEKKLYRARKKDKQSKHRSSV